jgi:hypothetical protein
MPLSVWRHWECCCRNVLRVVQDVLKTFWLIRMWNLGRCTSAGKRQPYLMGEGSGQAWLNFRSPRALIRMWSSSKRIGTQWRKYDDGRFFLFSLEDLSRLKHATIKRRRLENHTVYEAIHTQVHRVGLVYIVVGVA